MRTMRLGGSPMSLCHTSNGFVVGVIDRDHQALRVDAEPVLAGDEVPAERIASRLNSRRS
jgi:hypothetical protein